MTSVTSLRMRVLPRYPARITGTDGIKVERESFGAPDLIVRSAYDQLADIGTIPDVLKSYFMFWDSENDLYRRIPFQSMFDSAGVSTGYPTIDAAENANITPVVHAIEVYGAATVGDGLGGLYIDTDNGASETFVSGDGRTWYLAADIKPERLTAATIALFATAAQGVLADGAAQKAQNLGDLANKTTAKATLGMATRPVDVGFYGALTVGNAAVLLATFQAAINALPSGGGVIGVPDGDFSALVPGSLTVGNKAVVFDCRNRTTTLPANMPGEVLRNGVFQDLDSSVQSPRNVRMTYFQDYGNTLVTASQRQYAYHVQGFVPHRAGAPTELEFRAFSFNLGTDQNDIVDAIRGVKGRVYATAGQANIRAIYGFAESTSGGTHTGLLTGLLGTVYANGRTTGDMVGVRGHVDAGTLAAFQAAGAKVGETNDPFYGYMIRTGTGGPLLPKNSGFYSHGGGTGAMYQGVRDNVDLTVIFEVGKTGKVLGQSFYSGSVSIADDAVATITPPNTSGILIAFVEGADQSWATTWFRSAGTNLLRAAGTNGTLVALSTTALTGTTGADGNLNISCNNGVIQFENRQGASRQVTWEFICR